MHANALQRLSTPIQDDAVSFGSAERYKKMLCSVASITTTVDESYLPE